MVCSLPLISLGFMGTVLMVSERSETSLYLSLLSFRSSTLPILPLLFLYRIMPAVEQREVKGQKLSSLFLLH